MIKTMLTVLFFASCLYIVFGVLLYFRQYDFLYHPTPQLAHGFETKNFAVDGAVLRVTVLNKNSSKAVLYFGGNGESVDYNAPEFSSLLKDHAVYLVNYRGYGGSTGSPSEKALYGDALHIYDSLKSQHAEIAVIGRSLGSGVATLLASQREINKLVLVTPFDSIKDVAQKLFPIYPLSGLMSDHYDSLSRVKDISAKTLILRAEYDEVIGQNHTMRLAQKFPASQIMVKVIKDSGHNTISHKTGYYPAIKAFLSSAS